MAEGGEVHRAEREGSCLCSDLQTIIVSLAKTLKSASIRPSCAAWSS
jgi:hypothetical protein